MPMSESFKERLFPLVTKIMWDFKPRLAGEILGDISLGKETTWALSSGFHIYDETGILETIAQMKKLFFTRYRGKNFFAVKACPNVEILRIILGADFGLDCASPTELFRALLAGAQPYQIMYSSNNTALPFFKYAEKIGCILNLDDISFLPKLPHVPERICFRYNPGELRTEGSNTIIGNPPNQKYGLRHDQIMVAFRQARQKGVRIFGLHTMFVSNCRDPKVLASNARMLLEIAESLQKELDIELEFINIGGGLGISYKSGDQPLDVEAMAQLINEMLEDFQVRCGYTPLLYMESGRYVTGPHGVLVAPVINVMNKYKKFIGLGICDAADILRALIYPAHHEVSVLTTDGQEKIGGPKELVSIVGPLCENMHLAPDRLLPIIVEDDFVVVHDTGAHGIAMGSGYNGWGRSQELLLHSDNSVTRVSRPETIGDLTAREIILPQNELYRKTVQY